MNFNQLKGLGVGLGVFVLVVCSLYLWITYQRGTPNWYLLVMICGMALLLFYTFMEKRKRR